MADRTIREGLRLLSTIGWEQYWDALDDIQLAKMHKSLIAEVVRREKKASKLSGYTQEDIEGLSFEQFWDSCEICMDDPLSSEDGKSPSCKNSNCNEYGLISRLGANLQPHDTFQKDVEGLGGRFLYIDDIGGMDSAAILTELNRILRILGGEAFPDPSYDLDWAPASFIIYVPTILSNDI